MTEALPASPSRVVEQANEFTWDANALEPGIALALSGGGFRAMLFHAGALMRLNELGILSRVARISSVSGVACIRPIPREIRRTDSTFLPRKDRYRGHSNRAATLDLGCRGGRRQL